jgi:hypothetical protein
VKCSLEDTPVFYVVLPGKGKGSTGVRLLAYFVFEFAYLTVDTKIFLANLIWFFSLLGNEAELETH